MSIKNNDIQMQKKRLVIDYAQPEGPNLNTESTQRGSKAWHLLYFYFGSSFFT